MPAPTRQRLRLSGGTELSFIVAGEVSSPALLLLHGFPSSSRTFRAILPELSRAAYVIAPDLPGFGESDVLPTTSFTAYGQAIAELLDRLSIGPRYIYLHDFGAPVGLHVAMSEPRKVLGLVIQNANAHETGLGPEWTATRQFWRDPSARNEAEATAHLTLEGMRAQYTANVPKDLVARIAPENWEEDWRVMQLPGRLEAQRALIADYGRYVERFGAIADYLARRQPRALMLWGRHDAFFDLKETLSWMRALPRMESHVLDGGHFLLETHAAAAASLLLRFLERRETEPATAQA